MKRAAQTAHTSTGTCNQTRQTLALGFEIYSKLKAQQIIVEIDDIIELVKRPQLKFVHSPPSSL